jgi:hypothetical protein
MGLKTTRPFLGSQSNPNYSVMNYTAEHHKRLFWRRLPTKLPPLAVPQLCTQLAFPNILSLDSPQDHELLFFRCASFLQKDFPRLIRTMPNWIISESTTIREWVHQ